MSISSDISRFFSFNSSVPVGRGDLHVLHSRSLRKDNNKDLILEAPLLSTNSHITYSMMFSEDELRYGDFG